MKYKCIQNYNTWTRKIWLYLTNNYNNYIKIVIILINVLILYELSVEHLST